MKRYFISGMAFILVFQNTTHAQVNLQNKGTLYISGSTDILFVNGSFANASTGGLTNNGNLYVLQDLVNDQASMAIGTGNLYLSGSALQTLSGSQIFKTFNLFTSNAGGIILNNDLSISGTHTFTAGIITTSATPNYLQYEAGAGYSGDDDSKHVKGWIRKTGATAFTFPVGNGTVERKIGISGLSASSVFNALYAGPTTNTGNIAAPLVTVDPNEYWIVNQVTGGTATIDMNWDNAKIAMPAYLLANIRTANYITGNWTNTGGSATGATASTGNISSSALSSFGAFTFGSISLALPVTLVSFTATNSNQHALVSWTTTNEINVGFYEVQRSDDGVRFDAVGTVAARNVTSLQQYDFTDAKALGEITYYRLRSVDLDGAFKLSKVALLRNNLSSDRYMTIVNPASGSIHVIAKNSQGSYEYSINTLSGQTIQQGRINITAGGTADIILSTAVENGMYILQVKKTGFYYSQKVFVK